MKNIRWTVLALLLAVIPMAQGSVTKSDWGKTADGTPVQMYTITDADLSVKVITYGARIVGVEAPDRTGKRADVVLGYDSLAQYESDPNYFGAVVGRYGNRIAGGTFTLDGVTSHIPRNNGSNALHGGPKGFSTKVWTARMIEQGVEMSLVSPDGDMGFPGTLTVHVRYILIGTSLRIGYSATTTKPTVVNLTNHAYFNLSGDPSRPITDETIRILADTYTPVDSGLIPTGELAPVAGTPFDLTQSTLIGAHIDDDNAQLKLGGGYDHNFVLKRLPKSTLQPAAYATDPKSGRTLTVLTTEPGVQFYSGNSLLGNPTGKNGIVYPRRAGFCLETQHYPDSPNHPAFPSTVLLPGQTYHTETVDIFGVTP
jgi:aldose 1-epimerase